jgi:sugar lactone lactonase YvrE
MKQVAADVVVPAQCELAEGPVWDGRLRWVDILRGQVHTLDGDVHTWFDVGDPVGAVGLSRNGLVLALVDRFALADDDGRNLRPLGGFSVDRSTVRFNDGKPDPWGNFCAGTMPWRATGPSCALYRLRPDGVAAEIVGDVGLSNGLDWTQDRLRFYYADSATGAVDVFAVDPDTGALSERRRFVTVGGVPDGLTLDADGCVWVAIWGAGELRRYTPAGDLDAVVRLPVTQVTSAAFGGDDLATLYITTARQDFTPAEREEQPHAGDIFACTPDVTGFPPNRFHG